MTFELRIYRSTPGKMPLLLTRFREHTVELFSKHGIQSLGYWVSDNDPDLLMYIVQHEGIPVKNWEAFINDEKWIKARDKSEENGPLVESIESHYMSPTDFSKIK